jgi:N-acyl-D-amino-acid deacylase
MRDRLLTRAAFGFLAFALPVHASAADTLIVNARLADGRGGPLVSGSVRVRGDRIVDVGALKRRSGDVVVDAKSLVLAPGFIDTHSHHASGLTRDPNATEVISQGITTIVSGQDGGSYLPLAKFFAECQAQPAAINIASYSGHNSLREAVLGDDWKRVATAAEVAAMRSRLAEDMKAGALGLSTGLEYDPGIYSAPSEVLDLAKEAAAWGGRYISHIRSEDRNLWKALDEVVTIGRENKMPVQVSHAKLAMTDWWGQADRFLAVLDKARADGIDATLDIYPYTYWQSTLSVLWPERDFESRKTADYTLEHVAPADGLLLSSYSPDPSLVGKTIAEVAKARGEEPAVTLMDLVRAGQKDEESVTVIGTSMDERDVARLMAWPHANICSDGSMGGRHPRGAGAFTRILRVYVRERKVLTLPDAVRKMTGLAAQHMGFSDRGEIRPGAYADLVLFDPETVGDRATTTEPGLLSTGIDTVWVNGVVAFADGKPTGQHPGRVLRRASPAP